jgi:hypothetical protein
MNTRLLAAVVLAIGPPLWASGALAAQITFGPSAQSITFTGNGANSVTVVSQQLTGLALDTIDVAVGTLSLSPLSFIAGPQSGGLFPAGSNIETFTYSNPVVALNRRLHRRPSSRDARWRNLIAA